MTRTKPRTHFPCWSAAAVGHTLLVVVLASISFPHRAGRHDQPIEYEMWNSVALEQHHTLQSLETPSIRIGETADGWQQDSGTGESTPEAPLVTEDANPWSRQPGDLQRQAVQQSPASRQVAPASRRVEVDQAVDLAVGWLTARQRDDGGWNFDGDTSTTKPASTTATSLALLAIQSAMMRVSRSSRPAADAALKHGVEFLLQTAQANPRQTTVDFRGPNGDLVSHALATLALCEVNPGKALPVQSAYPWMRSTNPPHPTAVLLQGAVDFTIQCQDSGTGGWGTEPGAPGVWRDFPWHVQMLRMACDECLNTRLAVSPEPFLSSRMVGGGASYTATPGGNTPFNTAVGLLCRLLVDRRRTGNGWQGIRRLAAQGPVRDDAEYNFLVTQALWHANRNGNFDPEYHQWRDKLEAQLVVTQNDSGIAKGSWDPGGPQRWGRVGETSLDAWSLCTGARHLSMYSHRYRTPPLGN